MEPKSLKVFISHSSSDQMFVRTLKSDLNENNIQTWVDEDQLNLGDNLVDKLEIALDESSHFLIILSPHSVTSDWVRFELKKAIDNINSQLLQKIIPIKYSSCDIPEELKILLYADLSEEIREIQGDKVKFNTIGYSNFLIKVCKAIRSTEKVWTQKDKAIFKTEIAKESKTESESIQPVTIKSIYSLIGYKDAVNALIYSKKVSNNTEITYLKDPKKVKPVLLPPLLKFVLPNIKYGDKIYFSKNFRLNEYGHFAGFRRDDLCITLFHTIRKALGVTKGTRYKVEINIKEMRITFLDE